MPLLALPAKLSRMPDEVLASKKVAEQLTPVGKGRWSTLPIEGDPSIDEQLRADVRPRGEPVVLVPREAAPHDDLRGLCGLLTAQRVFAKQPGAW
jgi:hypothetical protein